MKATGNGSAPRPIMPNLRRARAAVTTAERRLAPVIQLPTKQPAIIARATIRAARGKLHYATNFRQGHRGMWTADCGTEVDVQFDSAGEADCKRCAKILAAQEGPQAGDRVRFAMDSSARGDHFLRGEIGFVLRVESGQAKVEFDEYGDNWVEVARLEKVEERDFPRPPSRMGVLFGFDEPAANEGPCEKCGTAVPNPDVYLLDGAELCRSCFRERGGVEDGLEEDDPRAVEMWTRSDEAYAERTGK